MMFGELANRSEDYQTGHETGTARALGYMQLRFKELEQEHPHKRYTAREISPTLTDFHSTSDLSHY